MKKYEKPFLKRFDVEFQDIILQSQITLEDDQDIIDGPFENI